MSLQQSKAEADQFERRAIVAALSLLCDPLRTMDNLQRGDVVQLKSGGPVMTINALQSEGSVVCQWFDSTGALKSGFFKAEQLRKAEPPEPQDSQGSFGTRSY
jgi:uncharacterized protein YodC (DUF2158 family)